MEQLSPMMQQYLKIKEQNKDCILFFRLGDFYEMFFDDARLASEELELTLTGRDCGLAERAPMCGVPHHSAEGYIARLIAKGYKVAICEQTEEPGKGKKLVERDIVRIITPGTVIENTMLDETRNNYICSIYLIGTSAGVCFIDISTGEASCCYLSGEDVSEQIIGEVVKFSPSEALVNFDFAQDAFSCDYIKLNLNVNIEKSFDIAFDDDNAESAILAHFGVEDVTELGFKKNSATVNAVGALLAYLHNTQKTSLSHINKIEFYSREEYMLLDQSVRRNLEICETMHGKDNRGSLLWAIDKTKTAMGRRLIRSWLEKPLMNVAEINRRLDAVQALYNEPMTREEINEMLRPVLDIERLLGRVVYGAANGRDLVSMAKSFSVLPEIKRKLAGFEAELLRDITCDIDVLSDIHSLITDAISEEAPVSTHDGKIIRDGYSSEVDELRSMVENSVGYLAEMTAREKEKTGIKNLKIGYNRVFGYYIEVSKSNMGDVPEHYIRKQTLANGERYITEELKDLEARLLGAQEKLFRLENEMFRAICKRVGENAQRIQRTSSAIAALDVLSNFASVSARYGYNRPKVNSGAKIVIKDGRHPVVERVMKDVLFVPNDANLDCGENRMAIITGPNMAGKSTFMRQVALITLLSQVGCFVPAKSAEIGVVDRIFTRIGASDDLASGKSTFMVEMSEVSEIIRKATKRSLIVLDEIGRGTSTFDGMAIARAVIEYVSDKKCIGAKTLFATHYHELTELEGKLDGVKNYNIAVKKHGFDITFLRKIVRGSADDSYGIEVARLAGIPDAVTLRARDILEGLEGERAIAKPEFIIPEERVRSHTGDEILRELSHMDVNTLSPLEAISVLFELAKRAREAE
ncbi:MAG: DNA mismatch repair protein MutS [Oscillospiraceae bacterium]|nr:DNA mismatch repair protein MutS [Oscillospiraceae bacterium]